MYTYIIDYSSELKLNIPYQSYFDDASNPETIQQKKRIIGAVCTRAGLFSISTKL